MCETAKHRFLIILLYRLTNVERSHVRVTFADYFTHAVSKVNAFIKKEKKKTKASVGVRQVRRILTTGVFAVALPWSIGSIREVRKPFARPVL